MKKFFLMTLAALLLLGCQHKQKSQPEKQPQLVEVERQECVLQHMTGTIPSEEADIGMTIDAPISGDKVLIDSIVHLINAEMYDFLESGHETCFAPEEVYCADPKQLVKHYYDAYKPFMIDSCHRDEQPYCFCDTHYLNVILIDQTESFVTYEANGLFIGEGDCWYRKWVTFCPGDGHQLQEVITTEDFMRFFEDHPEQQDGFYKIMKERLDEGDEVNWRNTFGLTKDKLLLEFFFAPGIVDDAEYSMSDIKPYLSDEAQKLLGQ